MNVMAAWNLGMLNQAEYEAVYVALTYYTDFETLGEPEPGPTMNVARRLLERLKMPDEVP